MDATVAALLWELGKLSLQQFLLYARLARKSGEEIEAAWQDATIRFEARPAAELQPPPE